MDLVLDSKSTILNEPKLHFGSSKQKPLEMSILAKAKINEPKLHFGSSDSEN